jgi:hypothetical protein
VRAGQLNVQTFGGQEWAVESKVISSRAPFSDAETRSAWGPRRQIGGRRREFPDIRSSTAEYELPPVLHALLLPPPPMRMGRIRTSIRLLLEIERLFLDH